jgi:hypothetical protein
MRKYGCGKVLNKGDMAFDRWGIILCPECDEATPASLMAVYYGGRLNSTATCGEMVMKAVRIRTVKQKKYKKGGKTCQR